VCVCVCVCVCLCAAHSPHCSAHLLPHIQVHAATTKKLVQVIAEYRKAAGLIRPQGLSEEPGGSSTSSSSSSAGRVWSRLFEDLEGVSAHPPAHAWGHMEAVGVGKTAPMCVKVVQGIALLSLVSVGCIHVYVCTAEGGGTNIPRCLTQLLLCQRLQVACVTTRHTPLTLISSYCGTLPPAHTAQPGAFVILNQTPHHAATCLPRLSAACDGRIRPAASGAAGP
jgi:hypothetical protein